jgi:FAD-linked sulfhydryl oxidase
MYCVNAGRLGGVPLMGTCPNLSTARAEVFGPSLWNSLHVVAQNFPDVPEPAQVQGCTGFVSALPYMIPNGEAAASFQRYSMDYLGNVDSVCSSGHALRQFFCNAHNATNLKLGKPPFDCSPQNLQAAYATAPVCISM